MAKKIKAKARKRAYQRALYSVLRKKDEDKDYTENV